MRPSHFIIGLTILLSLACGTGEGNGGDGIASLIVFNDYAESFFWLDYETDNANHQVMSGGRIHTLDEKVFENEIEGTDGDFVTFTLTSESLGEIHTFEPLVERIQAGGTYDITYDFDLASGDFVLWYGWE